MDDHEEVLQARESVTDFFEPRPTIKYTSVVGLQAGIVGAVVSTIQNALGTHNYGAAGVLTRSGGTIGFFGACYDAEHYNARQGLTICLRVQRQWGRRSRRRNPSLRTLGKRKTTSMVLQEVVQLDF